MLVDTSSPLYCHNITPEGPRPILIKPTGEIYFFGDDLGSVSSLSLLYYFTYGFNFRQIIMNCLLTTLGYRFDISSKNNNLA